MYDQIDTPASILLYSHGSPHSFAIIQEDGTMTRKGGEAIDDRPRRRRRRNVSVAEVIDFLEFLAPPSLSSPPSPYGLQAGAPNSEIRSVVVAPMSSFNALST